MVVHWANSTVPLFLKWPDTEQRKALSLFIQTCVGQSHQPPRGSKYFLLIVDDYSRYMWLELLKSKDEAHQKFKKVQAMAENEGKCRLRAFRSDRGGEFNSIEFKEYCEQLGIKHYTTTLPSAERSG